MLHIPSTWFSALTRVSPGLTRGLFAAALALGATASNAAMPIAVSSGYQYNCALTSAGGVKCWGSATGQLGNGGAGVQTVPGDVIGLTSGVSAFTAGPNHACAIMALNGTVKCWGSNSVGQLGDGTKNTSAPITTPVTVAGLSGATSIAVGNAHTCASLSNGTVKCWGDNINYQLGNGTAQDSMLPVEVTGLTNVVGVMAGYRHTCAWTTAQTVKCWGNNDYGQLGFATPNPVKIRTDVTGLSNVIAMTGGQWHTCALTSAGEVKCWGANNYGQVGVAVATSITSPTTVTGLASGVVSLGKTSGTANSNCAILASGEVKCWGLNNSRQLGLGSDATNKSTPTAVQGLPGPASAVSMGGNSACALVQDGVQCWGTNGGQLGNGTTAPIQIPVAVSGLYGSAPPNLPEPISPVTSATPTYVWKAIPGASDYRINVNGTITSYSAAQAGCDGGVGLCRIVGAALTSGVYTWYLQGYNSYGNGPWSSGTNFAL